MRHLSVLAVAGMLLPFPVAAQSPRPEAKVAEIARIPAIESKTWNQPVVVGDILLERNGEQMAAFRLPPASR